MRNNKLSQYRKWSDYVKEDFRKNPDEAEAFLSESLKLYQQDGDETVLLLALRQVAEAIGVQYLAKETGLTRQSIYKALSAKGNPTIKTFSAILRALGFDYSFHRVKMA